MLGQLSPLSSHETSPEESPVRKFDTPKLLVMYFNGVSCMGKSELLKRFESRFLERGIRSKKISLDKVAKGIMDEYKIQNNYTGEEAFTLCIRPIFDAFHQKIIDTAESMAGNHGVLMIDDCNVDPGLLMRLLQKSESLDFQVKFFRLYPQPHNGLTINQDLHISLSFQFILNLIWRVLNRGYHHTFNYCPEKKVQLVLSFVRVYEMKLETYMSSEGRLNESNHSNFEIEFHHEKELEDFSPRVGDIMVHLKDCLQSIVPFESPPTTAIPQLRKLVDSINSAPVDEIKCLLSYGRAEIWEDRFKDLSVFFD